MAASFFKRSARSGPTPFKYSTGLLNMEGLFVIRNIFTNIRAEKSSELNDND
ncbi:MAG TPA: hypothetical protein VLM16_07035 [Ginsengibacter sp.]|nr:hypothetical protein [Ginsengibacter sp.]